MTRKTGTTKVAAGTAVDATWHISGRGKNATYSAAVETDATPGQTVHLHAASHPGVMIGRLGEKVGTTDDGATLWTFERAMTPEDMAAYNAAKLQARAAWQASPEGVESMRKRAERAARKAAQAADGPDTKTVTKRQATPAELSGTTPATPPATPPKDMATMLAELLTAGVSPADAVATVQALQAVPTPASVPTTTTKTTTKTVAAKGTCEVCNLTPRNLTPHGSTGLAACSRCLPLDSETAIKRAARHGNAPASVDTTGGR